MSKSSPGNTKSVHLAAFDNSKQQEDVKLRGQLPDYDDSQRYDLGGGHFTSICSENLR